MQQADLRENQKKIKVRGAKQHNLKDINIDIPHNSLTVITGPSGSGKSSLAFDTLHAEGQRRYIESLSTYARQFLERLDKPDVESIEGLSPTIAIENKQVPTNPRSTVGTVTEIYDFLRLLFSHLSAAYCPECDRLIRISCPEATVNETIQKMKGAKVIIMAPLFKHTARDFTRELKRLERDGFVRVRLNGKIVEISNVLERTKNEINSLEVVIDRLVVSRDKRSRLTDSMELAYRVGNGRVVVLELGGKEYYYTENYTCDFCGIELPRPTPALFSFNNPEGACPRCDGIGFEEDFDPKLLVPDPEISIREGAILPWANKNSVTFFEQLESLAAYYNFDIDTPFKDLPARAQKALFYGSGKESVPFYHYSGNRRFVNKRPFQGIIPRLKEKLSNAKTQDEKREIERFIRRTPCSLCGGARLRQEALSFRFLGCNIYHISTMSVREATGWINGALRKLPNHPVASRILGEIKTRLDLLMDIGLHYITIDRPAHTLSGGEIQRIRLANQIGSKLIGVTYILDEPTIGLHPHDQGKLLNILKSLRDIGNTVIVVEHDRDTILQADYIVDIGPGGGQNGGRLMFCGTPSELLKNPGSITGKYLSGVLKIHSPKSRRTPQYGFITIRGAKSYNLKNIDVQIPLGLFTCVTGVSGSGKSTLVFHTLYKILQKLLFNRSNIIHGEVTSIEGWEKLRGVIHVSQGPIGKSPRSNPATFIGLFNHIRSLFSRLPESRARGYTPSRFSFNVKGGRCETCKGDGQLKIQMHFLPDIYITCPSCNGNRYNAETLEVRYKGKSIAEVLDLTVNQAINHFANIPLIQAKLELLREVGLGYIKLGQPANTLSTGESQRVKLAKELARRRESGILFLFDEPTTGLHLDDIEKLLLILHRLVDRGNTVLVIEHNFDFVRTADWVIDLGPGGGIDGGNIVAIGAPESIAMSRTSTTGKYLRELL